MDRLTDIPYMYIATILGFPFKQQYTSRKLENIKQANKMCTSVIKC